MAFETRVPLLLGGNRGNQIVDRSHRVEHLKDRLGFGLALSSKLLILFESCVLSLVPRKGPGGKPLRYQHLHVRKKS